MHFIRNWPEGLFVLLVMIVPCGISFLQRSVFWLLLAPAGLVVWVGIVLVVVSLYERKQRKTNGPRDT